MERKDGPTRIAGEIAGADKTVPEMARDAATIPATVGPAEIVDLGGGQAVLAANIRIPKWEPPQTSKTQTSSRR